MTSPATPFARIALRQGQLHWRQHSHARPVLSARLWAYRPRQLHIPTEAGNSAASTITKNYKTFSHTCSTKTNGLIRDRSTLMSSLLRAAPAAHLPPAHKHLRQFHQQQQSEQDDVISFYDDKITQYANQQLQTVTLRTLLGLGRTPESGSSPHTLETNLQVARYARQELPVRLARLIKATQKLPFIVGTNPFIKSVYKLYYDSFQTITNSAEAQEIRSKEDIDRFAALLQGLVSSHADVVPMLSQGFQECKKYMNKADIKVFLDDMIHARIGIRLIAEQVISLWEQRNHQLQEGALDSKEQYMVGVVHTGLKPAELIRTCASFVQELCDVNYGSSPEVVINGQVDAQFTYVPVHLEYILCELLKNAVRATVEHSIKMGRSALNPHGDRKASPYSSSSGSDAKSMVVIDGEVEDSMDETKRVNEFGHPPVEVTIAQGDHEITIRIRDQGGGISHSIFKGVSRLAMQAGLGGPIAGLGFGLPLTRIYTQYFGGDMHLISLQGHGCDVFIKLKQIDETLDNLQI
ncbi:hypothetical protein BGZ52_002686 [Haplosporangium bisporale]|nr:hypothetical protein BGZ52_002686 [Haplosporangium bisporale]